MRNQRISGRVVLLVAALFIFSNLAFAQLLNVPQVSPETWIKQKVGLSTIKIHYHRPAVKEREVWGKLVPYGLTKGVSWGSGNDFPWRAGANQNTTITFSHDVKINGKPLAAGTYGLHMIVTEKDWTVIFSSSTSSWGSFHYDPAEDVLRVDAIPQDAPHQEWLTYGFDELTKSSANVFLHWEKKKVGFKAEFDSDNIVINSLDNQLRGQAGFIWQAWQQAAFYCLSNNTSLDKGLVYINKSISMNENVNNRNLLGYLLFAVNKQEEAMKIYKENVDKYPENWNVWDSLGEGYSKIGDKKNAIQNYEKALEMAPEGQKKRIADTIAKLKA